MALVGVMTVLSGVKDAGYFRFREFVVYDGNQCYPEYLIKYKGVEKHQEPSDGASTGSSSSVEEEEEFFEEEEEGSSEEESD